MHALVVWFSLMLYAAIGRNSSPPAASRAPSPPRTPPQVAVTLASGERLAGQLVRVAGDRRLWLRVEGLSTVLMRPLPLDGVVAIERITPRQDSLPKESGGAAPPVTDAELAHRLLFDQP